MSDSSAILAELNRRKATLSPEKQALVEELNKRAETGRLGPPGRISGRAIRERPAGNLARIPEEKPVPGLFSGEYSGPTGTVAPGEPLLGKAARRVLGLTPLGPAINRLIPEEKGDRLTGALERQAIGGVGSAIKGVASIPKAVYEEGPAGAFLRPQIEQGKQAWQAGREGRLSEAVGHGIAALTPLVGPMVASATERAATGTVGPAAELATLAGAPKPVMRAAEQFLSVGKRIGKVAVAKPGTVEYNWAKGALGLLKKALQEDYATKTAAYPKIKPVFNATELSSILPKEHHLAGIRAAREKLDVAGLTEKGVRDARAELWTYRRRMGLPSDEFKAYGDAYQQLTKQLRGQYQQAGELEAFLGAEKGFAQHMETFHGQKSPITKALQTELPASGFVEPGGVFKKLGTTVAEKQIESLGGLGLKPLELFRMRQIGKFSDPAFSSGIAFTLKIPIIRQALEYLLTRPIGIKALEQPKIQPWQSPMGLEGTGMTGPLFEPPAARQPPVSYEAIMRQPERKLLPPGTYREAPPPRGPTPEEWEALGRQRETEFPRPGVGGLPARRYFPGPFGLPGRPMPPPRQPSGPALEGGVITDPGFPGKRLPAVAYPEAPRPKPKIKRLPPRRSWPPQLPSRKK